MENLKKANRYEINFIKKLEQSERKNGSYKKSVFHIHTPASHDYRIFDKYQTDSQELDVKKYLNKISELELIERINEINIFPPAINLNELYINSLNEKYDSKKEFLVYLLMAATLMNNDIELALIADHNTISGYKKLCSAINYIYDLYKSRKYCEVMLGVEITCADKNHVVGIFPNNKGIFKDINDMLDNILVNQKEGSYLTSIEIIERISLLGGLAYIAHINSANIFKSGYLSGAYKRKLFNSDNLKVLGVSDIKTIDSVNQSVSCYVEKNKEFCFFLDEDSHTIEELAKTYFWIKGTKVNFDMIRNAVRDYTISVEIDKPRKPVTYIRGMMIYPWKDKGFFCKNEEEINEPLIVSFSDSLSCLIGGRGTGKSTILKLLDFVLTRKCVDEEELSFFCRNQYIYVLAKINESNYLIEFSSPKTDEFTNILWYFNHTRTTDPYKTKKIKFDSLEISDYIFANYLKMYRILKKDKEYLLAPVREKKKLLSTILDQQYSINDLVEKSKSNRIDDYIFEKMFSNKVLTKPNSQFFRFNNIDGLQKN